MCRDYLPDKDKSVPLTAAAAAEYSHIVANYSHDNEGGFMLFCACGDDGLGDPAQASGTLVEHNLSLNDGRRSQLVCLHRFQGAWLPPRCDRMNCSRSLLACSMWRFSRDAAPRTSPLRHSCTSSSCSCCAWRMLSALKDNCIRV